MTSIPQGYCHDVQHAGQEIGHSLQTPAVLSPLLPSGHCHCGERLRTCQPGLANRDLDSRLGCNVRSVYRQRQSLWANPLLRHRSFLSRGGACDTSLRHRRDSARSERLESDRNGSSDRSDRSRLRARGAGREISGQLMYPAKSRRVQTRISLYE